MNFRESALRVLNENRPFVTFDISMRLSRMASYLKALEDGAREFGERTSVTTIGHLGDGNLHIGIVYDPATSRPEPLKDMVYRLTGEYGGSISAEHGIGFEKKGYLRHSRSTNEIELMNRTKKLFDPNNILSPGRIFDASATGR